MGLAALAVVAAGMIFSGLGGGEGSLSERGETPTASFPDSNAPTASPGSNGGPTDEVISDLQQKLEDDPEDFRSHIDLANAYLQKVRENGDPSLYTRAEELLERAEELEPRNPELLATSGILALARHDFAEALELGEEARAESPGSARYHGIIGDAQIELGSYEAAVGSYQEMVDLRPDFESYSRVSHARELYGDHEGAMEAMQVAIDAGPAAGENTAWAHVQLGNLHFTTGDLEGAAREYDRSLLTLAEYPLALAGQGRIAAARGEMEEAATLYEQAFDRMPLPEHAIALGNVYAEMGGQERAEEQYEVVRAMDQLFQEAGVDTDLEIALFFADHDIELQESLAKARSAYESRPSIHAADVLAWTLYKSGEYEEAQGYASEALELGTRDPLKLFHAGMIASELGQEEKAREYLQQAVELNPRFSPLHDDTAAAELEELEEQATTSGGDE